ncbi:hypothetical protein LTR05_007754 [Lithohypha guttulata]|uniref:Mob1/phocein n=1 Tax=Lithohypha guttulata TaxID=1690604 RepID=A0AAN7SV91_9EURO|nr:hypothetical protein LTR05_007754 [Lithohypha guttulata]
MAGKSPARSALREGGPPSSPRLPSPPPLPELQLGPRSPSINAPGNELSLDDLATPDEGAARRVRPGTSALDMARGPPFVPLHQLESPFQLQEYLKSSYASKTLNESSHTLVPITKETAMELATPPIQQDTGEPIDRNLWLYELCRFLVQRTNRLIVSFFADSPPCSSQTCPEMRASEWQYLCAVHEPPKSCCAIDYCCHTLDWAANVLTSTKHFPSRLSLGGEGVSASQSMRQLTNIFRRVYRIYAHAWFQHREAFWMLEQEEGLYKFFRTVCDAYSLIPEDNYTIPPDAEGEKEDMLETPVSDKGVGIHILRNDTPISQQQMSQPNESEPVQVPTIAHTQRRHRHTPSTGTQVNSIAEGAEEEEEAGNTTQLSQTVASEPTATSTRQMTASPPKVARSPRPEGLSMPTSDPQLENLRAPEDPTPTPERRVSDPFSETGVSASAADSAVTTEELEAPPTVTAIKPPPSMLTEPVNIQHPHPSKTPIPSLQMEPQAQTPPRVHDENEEVRSPSGGSIRTVGDDILSGVLAHMDEDHDTTAGALPSSSASAPDPKDSTSSGEISSVNANETSGEKQVVSTPSTHELTTAVHQAEKSREVDADEEMDEIKLDRIMTAVKVNEEVDKQSPTEAKEDVKDDGMTKEETAAGVV